jgi:hypothetical protein
LTRKAAAAITPVRNTIVSMIMAQMLPITEVSATTTAARPSDKQISFTTTARIAVETPDPAPGFLFIDAPIMIVESRLRAKF